MRKKYPVRPYQQLSGTRTEVKVSRILRLGFLFRQLDVVSQTCGPLSAHGFRGDKLGSHLARASGIAGLQTPDTSCSFIIRSRTAAW